MLIRSQDREHLVNATAIHIIKPAKKSVKAPAKKPAKKVKHAYFNFKGLPEYAVILASASIEAAGVANNHAFDYGQEGFDETLKMLESLGIDYAGYGNYILKETNGVKIGVLAYSPVSRGMASRDTIKTEIQNLKDQGADIIIVSVHAGAEGTYYPTPIQKEFAYFIINSGADIYVGHHPHTLQGIEVYKEKYIIYSLGNFIFGGNSNPRDKDALIAQAKIEIDGEKKNIELKLIPVSISSTKDRNDYRPMILEGSEKQRVIDKINALSKDLNFKYIEEEENGN